MGWKNVPMVFGNPMPSYPNTEYPINVIEEYWDGTTLGTIDEDRLTAAKRIILDGMIG